MENSFLKTLFIVIILFQLKPVLSQVNCSDTSTRFNYKKDSARLYLYGNTCRENSGNLLITGAVEFLNNGFNHHNALLVSFLKNGSINWVRRFYSDSGYGQYAFYSDAVIQTSDNGYLVAGRISIPNPSGGKAELFLVKLTPTLSIQWSQTYASSTWDPNYFWIGVNGIIEDQAGNFYISGNQSPGAPYVAKFNASGTPLWSRSVSTSFGDINIFLDLYGSELRLYDRTYLNFGGAPNNTTIAISILRFNTATGDTLPKKAWYPPNPDSYQHAIGMNHTGTKLIDGRVMIAGSSTSNNSGGLGLTTWGQHIVAEFDQNLDFVNSYSLGSSFAHINLGTRVFNDRSVLFTRVYRQSNYSGKFIVGKFKDGQVIHERVFDYQGKDIWANYGLQQDTDSSYHLIQNINDSLTNQVAFEGFRLYDTDTASTCLGRDTSATQVQSETWLPINFPMTYYRADFFYPTNRPVYISPDTFATTFVCQQVSYCDSFRLLPSGSNLCPSDSLIVTIKKNKNCHSKITWNYSSSSVQSFTWLNDTTVKMKFNPGVQGWIKASIEGCQALKDSFIITVNNSPVLEIGADTVLCSGTSFHLNAHTGFASYSWQDGSTDSIFTVTQPGTYYVSTVDYCGFLQIDSINVVYATQAPINIGPDRTKCNNDTILLNAPPGFLSYLWSNSYNISSTTAQQVIVNPLVDTAYFIKAELAVGCFAYDTVRIKVHQSSPPDLGADQSICQGENVTFDAGNYASYVWNDGSTTKTIQASGVGIYAVEVTDNNGCKSRDTTVIISILQVPSAYLPPDTSICNYRSLELKPNNNFSKYLWSSGSSMSSISVNQPGTYWLLVTDNNGCTGKDSILVTTGDCVNGLFVPDAFTPNGDNKNDVFRAVLFGKVLQFELAVYNRWGEVVFRTSDWQQGWDGSFGGSKQATNVFAWKCKYQLDGEPVRFAKGTVVLIR